MSDARPPALPEHTFAEPWQAYAFAFTLQLADAGCFTWAEWTAHFAAHLKSAAVRDHATEHPGPLPETNNPHYYDVWLDSLQTLLIERGIATTDQLDRLKNAWTTAYLTTPHGKPVVLHTESVRSRGLPRV